jgi:hypothetical protein
MRFKRCAFCCDNGMSTDRIQGGFRIRLPQGSRHRTGRVARCLYHPKTATAHWIWMPPREVRRSLDHIASPARATHRASGHRALRPAKLDLVEAKVGMVRADVVKDARDRSAHAVIEPLGRVGMDGRSQCRTVSWAAKASPTDTNTSIRRSSDGPTDRRFHPAPRPASRCDRSSTTRAPAPPAGAPS